MGAAERRKGRWKEIKGFGGRYLISSTGLVRSHAKGKPRTLKDKNAHKKTYSRVNLYHGGVCRTVLVHRLVAEAFIPNPERKPCVDHIDNNKKNNHAGNLRWASYKENSRFAAEDGLLGGGDRKGIKNGRSKLTEREVLEIRANSTGMRGEIAKLASKYGVGRTVVRDILVFKSWTHL